MGVNSVTTIKTATVLATPKKGHLPELFQSTIDSIRGEGLFGGYISI
jgi:hypothetical protein